MTRALHIAVPVLLAGILWPASPSRAASAEELLQGAGAARQAAEKDLAEARKRHLAERKALAAELQREYAALAAAKAEATEAAGALKRAEATAVELERTAVLTGHQIRALIAQASGPSGAAVDPNDSIEAMEQAIWRGFADRLAGIEADLKVTIGRETVVARDGAQSGVPVIRLGAYAAYACGEARGTCGLLRVLPGGRKLVAGPYLTEGQVRALRAAAGGDLTRLPIDVDGSLINRAPTEPKSVAAWLSAGGMFIYPIIVVGALGLLLVLERIVYLVRTKPRPALMAEVLGSLERRDPSAARAAVGTPRTPTARVLLAGVDAVGKSEQEREGAMESTLLAEAPKLERSLSLLGALAGVAPLLGLLGTVSGMIATFDTISVAGTGNPRLLSGGICEALITTQLGLMVAIPLLLAHAWLSRWVERREAMLEHNAIQVFGIHEEGEAP